jgi:hypothetical protein
LLVAGAWLALAGCKKPDGAVAMDGAGAAADGAAAAVTAAPADAAAAAPLADAAAAIAVDAAAPLADAAAAIAADAAAPATNDAAGDEAGAPAPDAGLAPAPADASAGAAAAAAAPSPAASGPWGELATAALSAVREGDAAPLVALVPPFRAARAGCAAQYPDTAAKRAEWSGRIDRQQAELETALRACRELTDWSKGTPAPATWSEPAPVEGCDDLAESDLRVLVDPGGEAGAAGTRYTVTVGALVVAGQPYATRLLCGVRQP